MKVLVTGAAGFLGSHLVDRLLADGREVVALDDFSTGTPENLAHHLENPKLTIAYGDADKVQGVDVRDAVALDRLGRNFDRIYHLACPASPPIYQRNPVRTLETGFWGTRQILQLASWNADRTRVLIASSSEVYGQPIEHPQHEGLFAHINPYGPRACYDAGKVGSEALAYAYKQTYAVDARVARIHNTYGPRLRPGDGRAVPTFISQALRGLPVVVFGDGSQTRSLCYVTDMIDGLVRLMEAPTNPGPLNLGNPAEITMRDLAGQIVAQVAARGGPTSEITYAPLPIDDPIRRRPDITCARELLAWAPRVQLTVGLVATIAAIAAENAQITAPFLPRL